MTKVCHVCGRPKLLDAFSGEGGAGKGYMDAGFCVTAVDKVPDRKTPEGQARRLENYPTDCPGAETICADAIETILTRGHEFAAGHGSPTCTGYSRGTAAVPDRFDRYDRLIPATRAAFEEVGLPYVIENVEDAKRELQAPALLCGRMFGLTAVDEDGTVLTLDRHRVFETNWFYMPPEHTAHSPAYNRRHGIQVAGSYGGARRDKHEARFVRKGGYVPKSLAVQRELLGTPWMSEKGCQLSIPPVMTAHIGAQLLDYIGLDWKQMPPPAPAQAEEVTA